MMILNRQSMKLAILVIMTPNVNAKKELPRGIISVESQNETCPEGYDITKDGQHCVRAQEVDCNRDPDSPVCTGKTGRGGSIFCDEYAGLTDSRIAYGGCYDRNDIVGEYCDKYHEEEENGDGWSCKELRANYDAVVTKGEHCDNNKACSL